MKQVEKAGVLSELKKRSTTRDQRQEKEEEGAAKKRLSRRCAKSRNDG
jgi:ribosomal protein S21